MDWVDFYIDNAFKLQFLKTVSRLILCRKCILDYLCMVKIKSFFANLPLCAQQNLFVSLGNFHRACVLQTVILVHFQGSGSISVVFFTA